MITFQHQGSWCTWLWQWGPGWRNSTALVIASGVMDDGVIIGSHQTNGASSVSGSTNMTTWSILAIFISIHATWTVYMVHFIYCSKWGNWQLHYPKTSVRTVCNVAAWQVTYYLTITHLKFGWVWSCLNMKFKHTQTISSQVSTGWFELIWTSPAIRNGRVQIMNNPKDPLPLL